MFTTLPGLVDQALIIVRNEHEGAGAIDPGSDGYETAKSVVTDISRRLGGVTLTQAYSGTGSAYQFAIPSWWVAGFSFVQRLIYPVSTAGAESSQDVDPAEFWLYPDAGAPTHIRLPWTPALGTNNILLVGKGHYTATDTATTIPTDRQRGFELAVAAEFCLLFSTYHAHTTHPTQDVDGVDGQAVSKNWLDIREKLLERAGNVLELDLSEGPPGGSSGGGGAVGGAFPPALAWADIDPTVRGRGLIGRSARDR